MGRTDCESEEAEAEDYAYVSEDREYPHGCRELQSL
jgi:hypothetical protein